MENFKEVITQSLQHTLNVTQSKAEEVFVFLTETHGLECVEDLQLLNEDDLAPVLKTVQRRKFLLSWMQQSASSEQNLHSNIQPHDEGLGQTVSINEPDKSGDWLSQFSVPWERVPPAIMKILNAQKRPSSEQRRELVRIIADAIRQYTRLPGKKALHLITKAVVDKYPVMKDSLYGETVMDGNLYLVKQIRNRLENLSRGIGTKRKSQKTSPKTSSTSKEKQLGLSDKYGCINWQPSMTEEDEKLQEKEREDLLNYSLHGPISENDHVVKTGIEKTYALQRKEINVVPFSIGLFKSRWPCLFSKVGFLMHFKELVGIDLQQRFKEQLDKKGGRIVQFLKTVPVGSNKKNLSSAIDRLEEEAGEDSESLLDPKESSYKDLGELIYLLLGYFGEDIDNIFKTCEGATNEISAQRIVDLPCTPCILVCGGSIFSCNNFMILVDGIIVNNDVKSYHDAFLLYMAAYFVFNIKYAETVAATMEFIQRCLMNINPNRGNKQRKNTVKDGIMPRVLSLLNNLTDYEWL